MAKKQINYDYQSIADTGHLIEILEHEQGIESKEDEKRTRDALDDLERIARNWVRKIAIEQGLNQRKAKCIRVKLSTVGSHYLGVHQPGGTIEAVLLAPAFITYSLFFGSFKMFLRNNAKVESCLDHPLARIPLMKLKFSGEDIELMLVQLFANVLPETTDHRKSLNWIYHHELDVPALQGFRFSDTILRTVYNYTHFRLTLHLVKLWARSKFYSFEYYC